MAMQKLRRVTDDSTYKDRKLFIADAWQKVYDREVPFAQAKDLGDDLIKLVVSERDPGLREDALDALLQLTTIYTELELDFAQIKELLHRLPANECEFVIAILGAAKRKEILSWIEPFLSSKEDFLRDAATDAMTRIRGRQGNVDRSTSD